MKFLEAIQKQIKYIQIYEYKDMSNNNNIRANPKALHKVVCDLFGWLLTTNILINYHTHTHTHMHIYSCRGLIDCANIK